MSGLGLDTVTAAIRPRTPWEAVDLGFVMTRAWWKRVYAAWLLTVLPIWFAVVAWLSGHPWWTLLALWCLKPLFDRIPLFVISRSLFGNPPSLHELASALPKLLSAFPFTGLGLLRLDLARSYHLPVLQLEGLRGGRAFERARILGRHQRSTAIALTLACVLIEVCLFASLWGLLRIIVPAGYMHLIGPSMAGYWGGQAHWLAYLSVGAGLFLSSSLVQPFYVGAGFALYLNRRVALEGWDIEVAFRRLALRLEGRRSKHSTSRASSWWMVPLLAGTLWTGAALAAETELPVDRDPAQVAEEVLQSPEFGTTKTEMRWRFRFREPPSLPGSERPSLRGPTSVIRVLSGLVEVILWGGGAFLLGWVVYRVLLAFDPTPIEPLRAARSEAPVELFGLDLRTESLPDDPTAEALALVQAGEPTGALSLLYRATLGLLVRREEVPVDDSWTEGDCLRRLSPSLAPDQREYFRQLTRSWCSSAYAHRTPGEPELTQLCEEWRGLFAAPPA